MAPNPERLGTVGDGTVWRGFRGGGDGWRGQARRQAPQRAAHERQRHWQRLDWPASAQDAGRGASEGVASNADDDAPARLAAPEPRQHKETTMALAQYRSRRDSERSCPWFHTEEQLEAIAESVAGINATLKRAAQVNGPPDYVPPARTPSRLPGQGGHRSKPGRGFGGGGGGSSNFEA